jgi:hypothetical protein
VKRSTKILLISAALVVVLPLIVWSGALLYWHVRIRSSLRNLETQWGFGTATNEFHEGHDRLLLWTAGCRAFPYLVASLEEDGTHELYHLLLFNQVHDLASAHGRTSPTAPPQEPFGAVLGVLDPNRCSGNGPPGRRRCTLELTQWWHTEGSRWHQWWRVWTRACPVD